MRRGFHAVRFGLLRIRQRGERTVGEGPEVHPDIDRGASLAHRPCGKVRLVSCHGERWSIQMISAYVLRRAERRVVVV